MEQVKITVIGAGAVGLAIASELSESHDEIVVLERHDSIGQETSSRNSEVMHAGIYYPADSLKAKLCVEGISQLYSICEKNSIPHRRIGKLIVATDQSEIPILEALMKKGISNGVLNLEMIGRSEVIKMEPAVKAVAALWSPDTGIMDTHSLMKYFQRRAEAHGVIFAFESEAASIVKEGDGYIVSLKNQAYSFRSSIVINCAGLGSDHIAELAGIDIDKADYRLRLCKGSYFSYSRKSPVHRLIYPVPHEELAGLGVHATLDMGGRLRFGPDIEYIEQIDYRVDASKRDAFYSGAIKIIPGLDPEAFVPDMSGVRPKLQGSHEKTKDFVIREESDRGLPGFIDLIGIESPGLTSCTAIAKMVSNIVAEIK